MTLAESMQHPIRSISETVSYLTNGHHEDYMQDMHLVAESHGILNAHLPADREFFARRERERASAARVQRLQSLPEQSGDPVQ